MVRLDRTFSNYISSGDTRCAGCNMHWFGEVQAQRTSSNLSNCILTEIARCIDFFHMSAGWFDWIAPPLTASLQGIEGARVLYALVGCGSSTSNLIEPSRTTCSSTANLRHGRETSFTQVRDGSTVPNLLKLHLFRGYKVCRVN